MRAAEAVGNMDAAMEWEERAQCYRDARHRRRMDLLHSPLYAAKGLAVGTGMGIGSLVALRIVMAIANKDVTEVVTPIAAVIEFINLLITIVQVVWGPLVSLGPFLALLALWAVGSK